MMLGDLDTARDDQIHYGRKFLEDVDLQAHQVSHTP